MIYFARYMAMECKQTVNLSDLNSLLIDICEKLCYFVQIIAKLSILFGVFPVGIINSTFLRR